MSIADHHRVVTGPSVGENFCDITMGTITRSLYVKVRLQLTMKLCTVESVPSPDEASPHIEGAFRWGRGKDRGPFIAVVVIRNVKGSATEICCRFPSRRLGSNPAYSRVRLHGSSSQGRMSMRRS